MGKDRDDEEDQDDQKEDGLGRAPAAGLSWIGSRLPDGSRLARWCFVCCRCERLAPYSDGKHSISGINELEARKVGWLYARGVWFCSFCDPVAKPGL